MTTQKIVTGVVVGTVIALLAIPKTRKVIYDALGRLNETLREVRGVAEEANAVSTT